MRINADQLGNQLQKKLAPVYLVSGDEPLIVDECCAAVRNAARDAGFTEREITTAERGFDWNGWYASTQTLSLFSERRVLDVRLPAARPGDDGGKILREYAAGPPADILLLVSTGKLDKQTRAAGWVQALEGAGVAVTVYPVAAAQLPSWIGSRMRSQGLAAGPGVAELLAYRFEGNLLAASQEIEKLSLLFGKGAIGVDDIQDNLGDNARFNVFALVDTCLRGEGAAVTRMLGGLRGEGENPVLLLTLMIREIRALAGIANALAAGMNEAQAFRKHQVWTQRQPLVRKALGRSRPAAWLVLLQRAARADRVLKGRLPGDVWQELQCLGLGMCGVRVRTCQAGNRVI